MQVALKRGSLLWCLALYVYQKGEAALASQRDTKKRLVL